MSVAISLYLVSASIGELTFSIDDHVAFAKELIDHLTAHLHEAASIVAKVDDIALCPSYLEVEEGGKELVEGVASEIIDKDVADVSVEEIFGSHAIDWNVASLDFIMQYLIGSSTTHAHFHNCTFHTLETLLNLGIVDLWATEHRIVDLDYAVACHQAHFLGRTSGNDLNHHHSVVLDVELHSDARE